MWNMGSLLLKGGLYWRREGWSRNWAEKDGIPQCTRDFTLMVIYSVMRCNCIIHRIAPPQEELAQRTFLVVSQSVKRSNMSLHS